MIINRVFFVMLGLMLIYYIFSKVKKNLFSEKESFFWMVGVLGILQLSLFPYSIDLLAKWLNIQYPPSLLFLLTSIFILFILFRVTQQISSLNEKFKELTQRSALLENRIRELTEDGHESNRIKH